jgi:multicomponent Na+:H+ antiporter subunit B
VTRRMRSAVAVAALGVLGAVLVVAVTGLEPFGHYPGPYGDVLAKVVPDERHTGQLVAATVFDYRGFDTLGEEFMLFAAVMGVALLLREARDEGERPEDAVRSDAVGAIGLGLVGPTIVVGLYVVAHGYLTPGGGFQGGVATAGGLLLLYAAGRYSSYRAASPRALVDLAEGTGAGAYAAVGVAALIAGAAFLDNVVRLGTTGTLASGGTIPILNAASALEVTAALVLLFHEFLEEVMASK